MSLNHLVLGTPFPLDAEVKTIKIDTSPALGKVLTSDASGNGSWQPLSGGAARALHLTGTQGAVDVSNVSVIFNSNALIPLVLQSLANGVSGQTITIISNNTAAITIKQNTSIGSDQPFQTYTSTDLELPTFGNSIGYALATYDATFGRWCVTQIN